MLVQTNLVLRVAVFVALSALACGTVGAQQHSITYQINPAHTGAVEFAYGFDVPLQKVWSRDDLGRQISYPIVIAWKVFVTVAYYPQQHHGTKLFALALRTGETLWSIPTPGSRFAPAYDKGRLFVINSDGLLRAIDPDDGSLLWSRQLPGQYDFGAPPTARDGIVYIGGSGSDGTLYAVSERDGEVIWTQRVLGGDTSAPTLSSDGVFVSYPCQVYQFEKTTGAARWHFTDGCDGGGGATAVFYSDRLYTRDVDPLSSNTVHILDTRTGTDIGTVPNVTTEPAFRGDIGYFADSEGISALSVTTQAELWRFTDAQQPALPPIVVNGKVIVCSTRGQLYVLDGTSGQVLQNLALGSGIPIVYEPSAVVLPGLGVGGGLLLVPAGRQLVAFRGSH